MHRRASPRRHVLGCAQPIEVAHDLAVDPRMDIRHLLGELDPGGSPSDRTRKIVRRVLPQCQVYVRQVFTVQLIEVAVVGGMVLRSIPPIPVAALRDKQFFVGQPALLLRRLRGAVLIDFARCMQVVPRQIVFRRSDPYVEIGIDP